MAWSFLSKLESNKPFTEREAWGLFRIIALSEAGGWTILITGILIHRYKLPGHTFAIPLAGQIHGTIFLLYFGILVAVYSSLGWSRKKFILAVIAGVPPYGTLLFEQWAAQKRQAESSRRHFYSIAIIALTSGWWAKSMLLRS
jgi:integral membrane protein